MKTPNSGGSPLITGAQQHIYSFCQNLDNKLYSICAGPLKCSIFWHAFTVTKIVVAGLARLVAQDGHGNVAHQWPSKDGATGLSYRPPWP